MLTLTENACTAVTTIVEKAVDGPGAGLRIAEDPVTPNLGLVVAETPEPGDEVIEDSGARLFLDQKAVEILDDKILDAEFQPNGAVQFTIAPQAGPTGLS